MLSIRMLFRSGMAILSAVLLSLSLSAIAQDKAAAQEVLNAYGPGGPAPAMKEAAAAFEKKTGVKVNVTAGPTPQWLEKAKADADLIFSGSEHMMTDFVNAMDGQISHAKVTPLYLRPLSILVRPGNPKKIRGVKDLLKPGVKVLVVQGAGQTGVWEDMAGRKGDIGTVIALRRNIVAYTKNSAEAKQAWIDNKDIDAWLIWNIWQVANPTLADSVPVERDYLIYRDSGLALTGRGEAKPSAKAFADYLLSDEGAQIFAKWGWMTKGRRNADR